MAFAPTSPVTGAAVPGFTSPTYTLSQDTAPTSSGKQFAVTGLSGTGLTTITGAATPFTHTFFKPPVLKVKQVDSAGRAQSAPNNVYKCITRKSVMLDSFGTTRIMLVTTTIEVPAGSESYDPDDVKAALSSHIGLLSQQSSGVATTVLNGVL